MKAKTIILIILVLPICSFAQFNSSIDLIAGFEYSYRSLNLSSDANLPIDIIALRNSKETGKLNWRFGLNYNRRLSTNIFLKTGIRLASVGYKGEKLTDLRWPSEIGSSGYMLDPSLPHEMQLVYDFWFIEIPLAGRIEFSDKKLSPFIEVGVSPSYYLSSRTKSITDLETTTTSQRGGNSPYSNLHLVGVISLGTNYSINDKMQIFGQATYRRHMTRLVDAPIQEYLFNYGMELGVRRLMN